MAGMDGNGGRKGERNKAVTAGKFVNLAEKLEPGAAGGRKFGTAGVYRDIHGVWTPVTDAKHYAYRDRRLYGLNAVEFDLLFELERIDKDEMEAFIRECEQREAGLPIV